MGNGMGFYELMNEVIFRELPNGYLVAPHRGDSPKPPEGYELAYGEQYVFAPILLDCEYRQVRTVTHGCCGKKQKIYCNDKKTYIGRKRCSECANAKFRS